MDTTPLLKNATRTQSSANSETLKRKIEILDVLNEIYGEGIPDASDPEQVRPITRGIPNHPLAPGRGVSNLRKSPIYGAVGDRSPAREELEETTARESQEVR